MSDRKPQHNKRSQDAKNVKDTQRMGAAEDSDSDDGEQARNGKQALSDWTDIVGQRIEQAMREGAFDNLPGKGKPLDLKKNPFVPEDRQMAYKLLENNDLAPSWISERTRVLDAVEDFREEVRSGVLGHHAWLKRTTDPSATNPSATDQAVGRWKSYLATWSDAIAVLNKRIETVNLQQPIAHLEIIKLRLPDELTRAGAGAGFIPSA